MLITDAGPMTLIAAGHLGVADDDSKLVYVITTAELPGSSSSTSSSTTVSETVRVVKLAEGPAAERPFVGTHMDDSKNTEEPGVRVQLTPNYGMTVFSGSCAFLELHYQRKLENGSFVEVCAPLGVCLHSVQCSLNTTSDMLPTTSHCGGVYHRDARFRNSCT